MDNVVIGKLDVKLMEYILNRHKKNYLGSVSLDLSPIGEIVRLGKNDSNVYKYPEFEKIDITKLSRYINNKGLNNFSLKDEYMVVKFEDSCLKACINVLKRKYHYTLDIADESCARRLLKELKRNTNNTYEKICLNSLLNRRDQTMNNVYNDMEKIIAKLKLNKADSINELLNDLSMEVVDNYNKHLELETTDIDSKALYKEIEDEMKELEKCVLYNMHTSNDGNEERDITSYGGKYYLIKVGRRPYGSEGKRRYKMRIPAGNVTLKVLMFW